MPNLLYIALTVRKLWFGLVIRILSVFPDFPAIAIVPLSVAVCVAVYKFIADRTFTVFVIH